MRPKRVSSRKPECESPHRRIGRQVPEQLASELESLEPLISCSVPERRAATSWPEFGVATQVPTPELRRSPGQLRPVRPAIWPSRVRPSSLRSAYYLLTIPNRLLENLCRFSSLRLVVSLNGVQEVGSSNLPGPTIFPPVTHHFPTVPTALSHAGLRRCPPNPCPLLIAYLFSDRVLPPGFSLPLARAKSNRRANVDRRGSSLPLACVDRARGRCDRELPE